MKNKPIIVIAVVIVSLLAVGIFKDQLIKAAVTVTVTRITGAPVGIGGFSLGLISHTIKISDLRIYNPAGFKKGVMLDISRAMVSYNLGELLKRKLHLYKADLQLKEFIVQKNQNGELNVDSLRVAKKPGEAQAEKEAKPAQAMPMQIDFLKLGIGRIIYKDNSDPDRPQVILYDVNINKEYKNISSAQQLALLVITEPLKQAGIQGAKVYGAAMLTGVAFLPAAAVMTFAGQSHAQQEFSRPVDQVYEAGLAVFKQSGSVSVEDKPAGTIKGVVNGADTTLQLNRKGNKTEAVVTSRKFLMPKPEIAAGIVYQISEKLK